MTVVIAVLFFVGGMGGMAVSMHQKEVQADKDRAAQIEAESQKDDGSTPDEFFSTQ